MKSVETQTYRLTVYFILRAPPPTQESISASCGLIERKLFLRIDTNLT